MIAAQGLTYGAAPGGGSESLRDTEQKTVGPSRVKKREIAGPPVIRDPDRMIISAEALPDES